MREDERVTVVTEGELVVDAPLGRGRTANFTVLPACAAKHGGAWYCTTHRHVFRSQLDKDAHIHRGRHRLAWVCAAHGVEVP